MLTVDQLESFYTYFYSKKYSDHKFRLKQTKTTLSVCNSFLSILDKKYNLHCVGEAFLWEYYLFQFQYWHELTLENKFTDKVVLAWIIGKKAFERWDKRDREFDWQIDTYPIIELYQINQKDLIKNKIEKPTSAPYDSSKRIRKEFLNTDKGFAVCVQMTTLYDPKDMSCIRCKYRTECKELLRVNYPELYNKRIEKIKSQ